MRKVFDALMIPLMLFLIVLAIYIVFGLFIGATTIIGEFLKATTNWIISDLWKTLAATLVDPWKLLAIPIALGGMILFVQNLLNNSSSAPNSFVRGRQIAQSRGQRPLSRPVDSTRTPPSRKTPPSSEKKLPKRPGR